MRVLGVIGDERARVFDAFAGEGLLYRRVWWRAAAYTGCDTKWLRDDRLMFAADSRRVLRVLDLSQFTVFDFDAYGSPWEHVVILCARRRLAPGERLGLLLTDGSGLHVQLSGLPIGLRELTGFLPFPGVHRLNESLVNRAIVATAQRLRATVLHRWEAHGRTGARMRYIGLVLEGQSR